MNRLRIEQSQRNRQTQGDWSGFRRHREVVTSLVQRLAASRSSRLAVLGAGNSNDLDLPRLLDTYQEIHLADLDEQAMQLGLARQGQADSSSVVLYPGWDATGIIDDLANIAVSISTGDAKITNMRPANLRPLLDRVDHETPSLPTAPFDAVVSVCLLSQLIDSVSSACCINTPQLDELILAIRDQHLRVIDGLRGSSGRALLVTDFVSSDTCPALRDAPEEQFAEIAKASIAAGNFFTGTNPVAISQRIRELMKGRSMQYPIEIRRPWVWQVGERRFAVTAIAF